MSKTIEVSYSWREYAVATLSVDEEFDIDDKDAVTELLQRGEDVLVVDYGVLAETSIDNVEVRS